jgi:RNase P/RNase MRP subunit POP5
MVRVKYRYICFRIEFPGGARYSIETGSLLALLKDSVLKHFGAWGYARLIPKTRFMEYKPHLSMGVMRVPLAGYGEAKDALESILCIGSVSCSFRAVRASGMAKKAREFLLGEAEKE